MTRDKFLISKCKEGYVVVDLVKVTAVWIAPDRKTAEDWLDSYILYLKEREGKNKRNSVNVLVVTAILGVTAVAVVIALSLLFG